MLRVIQLLLLSLAFGTSNSLLRAQLPATTKAACPPSHIWNDKLLYITAPDTDEISTRSIDVAFVPSLVSLDEVSLQYPPSFTRRLFSSVPRRDYALYNISCQMSAEIVLLQGASSSGKSALIKLVAGHERPTHGHVTRSTRGNSMSAATPMLLTDKPPFDNTQSVQQILEREAAKAMAGDIMAADPHSAGLLASSCIKIICHLVNLLDDENASKKEPSSLLTQTPAQLSPSENYRLRLAVASLQSSLPGISSAANNDTTTSLSNVNTTSSHEEASPEIQYRLPAPILLLDEWLDFETRETSSKVEEALLQLVKATGAVVVCATHKPNLWKKLTLVDNRGGVTSQVTMCRGEILTRRQHHQQ